ncbi:DNA excision repair protein ERCC-6-like protein [Dinothrombium tinctorium]|uniref:DNA excision repair protein ERCC-6-like protein n=1 Tax=Dinothrombium tinctorium TaxID=1965070 RepID=A0A3S3P0S9_9ACAR|nr:DNA excision repair protein ERCC-6-like protein [Dinothrombium tinctorium]RWS03410.1 DNA excision repair protein ERCC-6-like protein [Dinothrombium tinctorium]
MSATAGERSLDVQPPGDHPNGRTAVAAMELSADSASLDTSQQSGDDCAHCGLFDESSLDDHIHPNSSAFEASTAVPFRVDISSIPVADDCDELQELGVKAYDQKCYEHNVLKQVQQHIDSSSSHVNNTLQSLSAFTFDSLCNDSQNSTNFEEEGEENADASDGDDEWLPSEKEAEDLNSDAEDTDIVESHSETEYQSNGKRKIAPKEPNQKKCKRESGVSSKKVIDDGLEKNYKKRIKLYREERLLDKQRSILEDLEYEEYFTVNSDFKVPSRIWNNLYSYQQAGVRWLWELHQMSCGGIIGDEMGLGKTIQVIAFLAGLSCSNIHNFREEHKSLGPVILVCPATVMHQWVQEFHDWWPPFRVAILHHTGALDQKYQQVQRNNCHIL